MINRYLADKNKSYADHRKSFDDIKAKYLATLDNKNLLQNRPTYWGGYSFKPYSFEFWTGNDFRLNKRSLYQKNKENWDYYLLEP